MSACLQTHSPSYAARPRGWQRISDINRRRELPCRPAGGWFGARCGAPHTETHGDHVAGAARGSYARDLRLLRHHAGHVRPRLSSPPHGLSSERGECAEPPPPDSFPTDIPQPNVNAQPRTRLHFTENIKFSCGRPRSGRGGRRFKPCHSDQHLVPSETSIPTVSPTDTRRAPPAPGERCHRSLACRRVAVRPHAVFVIFRRRKEDVRLLLTAGNLAPRARSPWAVVAATENWIVSRKLLAREVCGP